MKSSALRRSLASFSFAGDVLMAVTLRSNALPNLTARWPSPPSPTTPDNARNRRLHGRTSRGGGGGAEVVASSRFYWEGRRRRP
ncbi:hypothetical protein PR202_gb11933 [Eleusine coracana subsp. coracana]|uniref:Secreted protein n=1 Tax=Eleusine coracana subsp. coracana TaxID=191504 RepID=A0AAV5EP91_ELECO|nr:hypothetical protein PR202_gb11933 [Eleusine coracana subsp. coracana]